MCSCFGQGLLSKLDYARRNLLVPDGLILPTAVKVRPLLHLRQGLFVSGPKQFMDIGCGVLCYSLLHGVHEQHVLQIYVLAIDMHVRMVSGFDLSAMNQYLWYPGAASMDLDRYESLW